jgi:hypothetical protein
LSLLCQCASVPLSPRVPPTRRKQLSALAKGRLRHQRGNMDCGLEGGDGTIQGMPSAWHLCQALGFSVFDCSGSLVRLVDVGVGTLFHDEI